MLSRLFNIRSQEWPRLLFLYSMGFLFSAGVTWGETIIEASFLFHLGVGSLSLVFTLHAFTFIIATAIYTAFVDRIDNARLLKVIGLIAIILIALNSLLLRLGQDVTAFLLLYVLVRLVRSIFMLHWWTYVNEFYDSRSAKRVVPLLSSSSRVAIIFAGLTMPLLTAVMRPLTIVLLWMLTILAVLLLAWLMPRLIKDGAVAAMPTVGAAPRDGTRRNSYVANIREGYRYVAGSSYMRWMALASFLLVLVYSLLNYQGSKILLASFGSISEMSNFIGWLNAISSMIILPIQLFVLSRLVARIGVANNALVYPLLTLGASALLIAQPTRLISGALAYVARVPLRFTLNETSTNLLYNAVPITVKGRARAFVDGLVVPLGLLAGSGLLLLIPLLPAGQAVPIMLGLCAVSYLLVVLFVRRGYSHALIQLLEHEDFSTLMASSAEPLLVDATTLNLLKRRLDQSPSPDFTIFMAKLISELGGKESTPALIKAARKGNASVKIALIDLLILNDARGEPLRQLYLESLGDQDERVRLAALRGLEQLMGLDNRQFLSIVKNLLRDRSVDVKSHVLSILLRSGDRAGLVVARQSVAELLGDGDPRRRARGVYTLVLLDDGEMLQQLAGFLDDPEDEVRLEAMLGLETLSSRGLDPAIVPLFLRHVEALIGDPVERVREATLNVLITLDHPLANLALVRALTDSSKQLRELASSTLARAGGRALPELMAALEADDRQLRKMAAMTLARNSPEQFGEPVREHMLENVRMVYRYHARLTALEPYAGSSAIDLLRSYLEGRSRQLLDECFYLLTALHPETDPGLVVESLKSPTLRIRANGAEALESLTTPQMARAIAPLLDPEAISEQLLALGHSLFAIQPPTSLAEMREIMMDPSLDPLLKALMTLALGEIGARLPRSAPPAAEGAEPERRGRGRRLLDALIDAPEETAEDEAAERDDAEQPERRGRGRGRRLFDALIDAPGELPYSAEGSGLSREEIETFLALAREDALPDVRIAARAAARIMQGLRSLELADKEDVVLSIVEKMIFLKEVSFFQGMTIEQLKILANVCEEQLFAEEARIFEEGEPGGAIYIVVSGRVGIEREGERKGSSVRLATIEAHSAFGEMSLFDHSPRDSSAIAIVETLTLRLRREPLIALARQYPDMSLELINVLSQRLREANNQIARLTRAKPRELQKIYDRLD